MAELLEVDITGAPVIPQRAPVAWDASVDPFIGRHIQYAPFPNLAVVAMTLC